MGVHSVTFKTPDGVERTARWTLGTAKRLYAKYGSDLRAALNEFGDALIPELVHQCLYVDGQPPSDLSLMQLEEMSTEADLQEYLAVFMEAQTQGAVSKNVLAPRLKAAMEARAKEELAKLTGSDSGASEPKSSDSATLSSGTSRKRSTTRGRKGTGRSKTEKTNEHGSMSDQS